MSKEPVLSPEQVAFKLGIRETFDIKNADIETRKFRRLCQIFKEELKYLAFEIGDKVFYFEGAGKDKIMLRHFVPGPDITQYSAEKVWVVYGNEHPIIRKTILEQVSEIKGDQENVFKKSYNQIKQKTESRPEKKGTSYPEDFIKASDLI